MTGCLGREDVLHRMNPLRSFNSFGLCRCFLKRPKSSRFARLSSQKRLPKVGSDWCGWKILFRMIRMMWDAFVAWDANVASKADNTKESQNCSFFVGFLGGPTWRSCRWCSWQQADENFFFASDFDPQNFGNWPVKPQPTVSDTEAKTDH